jgi:hypothetical protein
VVIVCLSDLADWEQTLQVRRVPRNKILGVSGTFFRTSGDEQSVLGFHVFDATRQKDRRSLMERILRASGS